MIEVFLLSDDDAFAALHQSIRIARNSPCTYACVYDSCHAVKVCDAYVLDDQRPDPVQIIAIFCAYAQATVQEFHERSTNMTTGFFVCEMSNHACGKISVYHKNIAQIQRIFV